MNTKFALSMACKHKFYSELSLEQLNFEPETLIVGTFNPEWPGSNTAEWFYGRTAGSWFWEILPRIYGEGSLIDASPAEWKQFCLEKKVALTDIIACIDDAEPNNKQHNKMLGGYSDEAILHNFDDFEFTDIVALLKRYPTIKSVYITRGITEAFWRHLWSPVMHYCNAHDIHERRLLNPSGSAAYQHEAYNKEHPANQIPRIEDYILMRWREEWK